MEGEYRAGMGRVGREAEEIAFYDGGAREKQILSNAYSKLTKHINSIYKVCQMKYLTNMMLELIFIRPFSDPYRV